MGTRIPAALALVALASCSQAPPTAPDTPREPPVTPPGPTERPGTATPVDPGMGLPPGHPTMPLSDPTMNDGHVGRGPRRLDVDQFRAALINAVGVTWTQPRRILSAEFPTGSYDDPAADMLEMLAGTLGRPDYETSTTESLDPSVTFNKLVGDAARKACRDGITADLGRARAQRILVREVGETDTAASNPTGVRRNLSYLALRFWARSLPADSPQLEPLYQLFVRASTAPVEGNPMMGGRAAGTPADGWRAVCIALVTDPQFLTY